MTDQDLSADEVEAIVNYLQDGNAHLVDQILNHHHDASCENLQEVKDLLTETIKRVGVSTKSKSKHHQVNNTLVTTTSIKSNQYPFSSSTPTKRLSSKVNVFDNIPEEDYLIVRGAHNPACYIILQGYVKVIYGRKETIRGPWSLIGPEALLTSSTSLITDYSVCIESQHLRYVRLTRSDFQSAPVDIEGSIAIDNGTDLLSFTDNGGEQQLQIVLPESSHQLHVEKEQLQFALHEAEKDSKSKQHLLLLQEDHIITLQANVTAQKQKLDQAKEFVEYQKSTIHDLQHQVEMLQQQLLLLHPPSPLFQQSGHSEMSGLASRSADEFIVLGTTPSPVVDHEEGQEATF